MCLARIMRRAAGGAPAALRLFIELLSIGVSSMSQAARHCKACKMVLVCKAIICISMLCMFKKSATSAASHTSHSKVTTRLVQASGLTSSAGAESRFFLSILKAWCRAPSFSFS